MNPQLLQKIRVLRKRNRIKAERYLYRHHRDLQRMRRLRQRYLNEKHNPMRRTECA